MQQWTLESGILFFLSMLISSCRYASYWSLMNFMMGCQLNGIGGGDDEEREQKEETRKSTEYLISQTFDVREGFTNIPVLIVDLVSKAWCVNDGQLHPHPLLFNVCTRHTIIKHTHFTGCLSPPQSRQSNKRRSQLCVICLL